jgi:hypothetical protein
MLYQIIKESLPIIIAFLIGIIAFKKMNAFYRLLFAQLTAWILIYILSYLITENQKSRGIPQNNQWIFNINILIETTLLMSAAYYYFHHTSMKYLMMAFYFIFVCVFTGLIMHDGYLRYSHFGQLMGSLIIVIAFTLILRDFFFKDKKALFLKPEFWACGGLLLYFTCNIPYISLFNYLNENYPQESEFLLHFITDVLANFRYYFLAISFWLIQRNSFTPQVQNP